MKKTKQSGNFRLVLRFMQDSKRWFCFGILSSLLVTFSEMSLPQIIRAAVDSVFGDIPFDLPAPVVSLIDAAGGAPYLRTHIWIVAAVLFVIALLAALGRFSTSYCNTRGAETLVRNMRNQLFSHIQRLPFSWYMKNQTGDIIQRCTSDVETIKGFLSSQLFMVFRIVLTLALSLYFMFSMNPALTLAAAVTFPFIILSAFFYNRFIEKRFLECDQNEGILSGIVQENLTGVRVVRAFGREASECEKFNRQNEKYAMLWNRIGKFNTAFWCGSDFVAGLQILLILSVGIIFCAKGQTTPGEFIAFVSYNGMVIWPVHQLGRVIAQMSRAKVSLTRIAEIMNSKEEQDVPDACEPDMRQEIRFENVSFSYGKENPEILHNVSFSIEPGTTFAILGGTGSGKTTLMHLLCRLYELPPENGRITVGGVDLRNIRAEHIRRNIGIVLQEAFLFSRTIAENIGIGGKEKDLRAIRRAASVACVDDAIMAFPDGYDTVVGERGVTLSGGQKQRTAIARTVVKETPIMIFDDSLSAVDAETDAKIRKSLLETRSGSTVILISHRISTLMQADKILVLSGGSVEAVGTHEELIAREGTYRDIYRIQTGKEEETDAE